MSMDKKTVVWFKEVGKNDIPLVGGKGANLGEMTRAGIPVPPGFVVTAEAYYEFIESSGVHGRIKDVLENLNIEDSAALLIASQKVKEIIMNASMPADIASEIRAYYEEMGEGFVAVRSSATAEDLPEASFAGQQSTYLNIRGSESVINHVQQCWASLFEARAIYYREEQHFDHFKVGIAVPVQRMVESESSGVMFTVEPISSDTSKMTIEAIYGLGEGIVSGEVTPDMYIIDKASRTVLTRNISHQARMLAKNLNVLPGEDPNSWLTVPVENQSVPKITPTEVDLLIETALNIEKHYGCPQDIEWGKEKGKIFILQTRPVTTVKKNVEHQEEIDATPILVGNAASPGFGIGPVVILSDASQIDQVKNGDIIVAQMTTPDFVPAMKRAAAILTDDGGRTSHAAIVSRELGVPCVVGTKTATKVLTPGQIITVDGAHGKVYDGAIKIENKDAEKEAELEQLQTKTNVYVNLAQPELAEKVAKRHVDGVGLLRAEFIVSQIGMHPLYMIKEGRQEEYIQKLYEGILPFAKAFYPRNVTYRTTDFKTNEYKELIGGAEYEGNEENPMLGYRGASRYIHDPEAFKLEIEAIKRVRAEYDNVNVMIPFVRTVKELRTVKAIMEECGLVRSDRFKLWMMVEIPANVLLIEDFLSVGIDGVSIGSNDLTQLTLGIDRDNDLLADTFDERNKAVLKAIKHTITVCKKMGVTASICGQAPSVYPELTEKLVQWGITSVSVSPDMIARTRGIIADVEKKLYS